MPQYNPLRRPPPPTEAELRKEISGFKKLAVAFAAAGAISGVTSYVTLPPDDLRDTPEFTAKARELRETFRAECTADQQEPQSQYASLRECMNAKAEAKVMEGSYSILNRAALLFTIMFLMKGATAGLYAGIVEKRLNKGEFKNLSR